MIKYNDLINYELNKENHTAKVCHSECFCNIPRSIMFDSEEYIVTGINEGSLHCDIMVNEHYVNFDDDVEISSLDKNIFTNCSAVDILHIPPSLKELKDGWCANTPDLNLIQISPKNRNFKFIDNDMIVGKLNPESDEFDVLLFSYRTIQKVKIPSSIKRISPFCFENCKKIKTIEFSEDSELCSIGNNVFSDSSIEHLSIPQQLRELEDGWCANTPNLFSISVSSKNKNFKIIEEKLLVGKLDQKSEIYDVLHFACRDIEHVKIPSCIKKITKNCFQKCKDLEKIEIDEFSELTTIEEGTFDKSSLEDLFIPSNLKELKDGWCMNTSKMTHISVSQKNKNFKIIDDKLLIGKSNTNSDVFDILLFACRDIDKVIVPSYIKHISPFCFQKCKYLKSIEFQQNSNLQSIGKYAFSKTSIETINIPEHCQHIKEGSFFHCKLLTRIEFEAALEMKLIDDKCFTKTQLRSIQIPESVTRIGEEAFYECETLTSVSFSEKSKLESIGDQAFCQSSIINITIPKHVKHISRKAFYKCFYLENVDFFENSELVSIEEESFYETSIKSIEIPSSTKIIQNKAFVFCKNLQKVSFKNNSELFYIGYCSFGSTNIQKFVVPSSVKWLGKEIFSECEDLEIEYEKNSQIVSVNQYSINKKDESLYIGDNAKEFDTGIFFSDYITNVSISPNNNNFKIINQKMVVGKSNLKDEVFDVLVFACHDIIEAVIPSYIKCIGKKCFAGCTKLKIIKFESNSELTRIDYEAFCNSAIEIITLPNHVKTIGEKAFSQCTQLKEIEISEDSELEFIDKNAFSSSSLKRIFLPKNLKENSFELFCQYLSHITVSSNNKNFKKVDNMIVSKSNPNTEVYDTLKFLQRDAEQVKIPSYIKYLSQFCFYKCKKLESVIFDDNSQLKEIGEDSFYKTSIKSIVIPPNVKKIKEKAFSHCNEIETIIFPENSKIETIGNSVFEYSSITTIKFPDSLTAIKSYAFEYCNQLTVVEFSKNSKLTEIGCQAFNHTSISKITIPSHVKVIEQYTFFNCSKLKTVIFGKNSELKQICKGAFEKTSIESITIPSEVTYIGFSAFYDCSSLKNVIFEPNSKLEFIDSSAFYSTSLEKILIPANVQYIGNNCFSNSKLQEIQYEKESQLISIAIISFPNSSDIKIRIPSNVETIDTSYMFLMDSITNIEISPNNKYYKSINNNEMIAKKSSIKSDNYDTLYCACPQIRQAKIPSYIKYISPGCFDNCEQLTKIEFPDDSNLKRIGHDAFNTLRLERITIPAHVKSIKHAFLYCNYLKKVDFNENSELKIIGKESFISNLMESFSIPKNVIQIKDGWCKYSPNLVNVIISPENNNFKIVNGKLLIGKSNPNSEIFDVLLMALRDIKHAVIPSYIKHISSFCFKDCKDIKIIEFQPNSELVSIGKYAFADSSIECITIPENCKRIGVFCFNNTSKLMKVEFPMNSKLEIIPKKAFCSSSIKDVIFPPSVSMLKEKGFSKCPNLTNVFFLGESICLHKKSFNKCNNLVIVEFVNASKIHIHNNTFVDQPGVQILIKKKKKKEKE
ncbi:hypothetical protein M9Y10_010939 [Tritrichomonas musculus]|uniref:Surface antigen BspA-like n=1 Tax=Tritrichomonas musculus TaxID=1915356 RepID=A0ABR2IM69_9EUKA